MKKQILIIGTAFLLLSSCSYRVLDFTLLSTKSNNLNVSQVNGVKVKASVFYWIGTSVNDAYDKALKQAGADYDLLLNGVVRTKSYILFNVYEIEGYAVKSSSKQQGN